MKNKFSVFSLLIFFILLNCAKKSNPIQPALHRISADVFKKHVAILASDEFLGRFPGTTGEDKTIQYLKGQFKQLGLQPGNGNSYFQEVPLVRLTADPAMKLKIKGEKGSITFDYAADFIGGTPQTRKHVQVKNSDIIFVGYGIVAPEYNWNDYEGLDVKGKTVLILVNDPGYATLDSNLFTGKAMTYYGRWTYKYEEAARQGASAAIIIHETGAASYPWGVVRNSWSGPQYYLVDDKLSKSSLQFQGWITTESARKIFKFAGLDYEKIISSAANRNFKPVPLHLTCSVQFKNEVAYTKSHNVVAILPGDERSDEYIIYTAHWDHLGVNPTFKGDSILNGAVDNASGTAALLTIADAFVHLPQKPARSIMFLSVTAEEQGLLGSKYYVEHPLVPLQNTIANINMDGINIFGKTRDMTIIGYGQSDLDIFARKALERNGRYVRPNPTPEKGSYFRSDHFNFAKAGVPALYLSAGIDNMEHGEKWGLAAKEKWIRTHYHKPSDNYEPDQWKLDGMLADIRIYFEVGYDLSNTTKIPHWSETSPFRKIWEKMMKERQNN